MKPVNGDHLKLVFGLKLKQIRQDRGLSLKEVSAKTGLSVSYLSEIESGKKYPKPEKLIFLSKALDTPFDELVSMKIGKTLNPLMGLLDSALVREFPFQLFGINIRNVVDLATTSPEKAGALVRTLTEFTRSYDMKLEDFLFAALRSYQKVNRNYFAEIEQAASLFRKRNKLKGKGPELLEWMKAHLAADGLTLDQHTLSTIPELSRFRSVYVESHPPKLLVNPDLMPSQQAFILGRELGYRDMALRHRPKTSSWIEAHSFDQVLDNFKASYFAGALLLPEKTMLKDLKAFFKSKSWTPSSFMDMLKNYGVTPEMFFYRLSQLIPTHFDIPEIYYLRFSHTSQSNKYTLTKELNMSRLNMPSGANLHEHYCRRWLAISQLREYEARAHTITQSQEPSAEAFHIGAQRSHFLDQGLSVFNLSIVRPLSLKRNDHSSMTLGIVISDDLRKKIQFIEDPTISDVDVGETCERCHLTEAGCQERAAEPRIYNQTMEMKQRKTALKDLLEELGEDPS